MKTKDEFSIKKKTNQKYNEHVMNLFIVHVTLHEIDSLYALDIRPLPKNKQHSYQQSHWECYLKTNFKSFLRITIQAPYEYQIWKKE